MRIVLIAAASISLTACFTGVESTPRITVRASEARTVTAEDTLLADVAGEPFGLWQPGKRFHITDERFKLLLGSTAPADSLAGREIAYAGMHSVASPTGGSSTELTFTADGVDTPMRHTVNADPRTLAQRSSVEIPFAIEASMVEKARDILEGNTYYVLTPLWRDAGDRLVATGRKFVEVRIDAVLPGTTAAPLRLDFTDIATGRSASLFINPSAEARTPRTFANFFSLTDPRRRYADITPDHWDMIVEGRICDGMTRRECRLALGQPSDIQRMTNYSVMRERWTYENGVWLLFEDDILIEHRH